MRSVDLSKRAFLKRTGAGALIALLTPGLVAASRVWADDEKVTIGPDEALRRLLEGNRRHVSGGNTMLQRLTERRRQVATAQSPFATILGCSDSRVPPEIVFDHTLGDLFVIRVAGNVVHGPGLGSMEYSALHFGTPLIMVLGHARCGAVTATIDGDAAPGHVRMLVDAIRPAVEEVKGQPGNLVDNAVRAHVRRVVRELKSSPPILADLVGRGKLKVVGGYYDLDSGKVDIIA